MTVGTGFGIRTALRSRAGRATPCTPNPSCSTCNGSGTDPAFYSDCTMCWPPVSRLGNRINPHTGEILPSRRKMWEGRFRKVAWWVAATAWMTAVCFYYFMASCLLVITACIGIISPRARSTCAAVAKLMTHTYWVTRNYYVIRKFILW
jgi:hypothetical protein